jgi:hypothetical protein
MLRAVVLSCLGAVGIWAVLDCLGVVFQWEINLGDLVVGGGTLALAAFTFTLARRARESVEAIDMPFVIATPREGYAALQFELVYPTESDRGGGQQTIEGAAPESRWFQLRLWNMGKGPAMVSDVQLQVRNASLLEPLDLQIPVSAGQGHDLGIPLAADYPDDGLPEGTQGTLTIYFSHAGGMRLKTTCDIDLRCGRGYCRSYVRDEADSAGRPLAEPGSAAAAASAGLRAR